MASMTTEYRLILQSVVLDNTRVEILDGVEHLVVPVVAAVEGVLNRGLLTVDELEASLPAWEGVAVTLSHPTKDGQNISANTKHSIEHFNVGRFFNPYLDGTKFKGEFWINLEQLDKHEEDRDLLLARIENNETVEVSTAYFSQIEKKSGKFGGKRYDFIYRGLIPNHVAILLHEVGACDVDMGCGAPRINSQEADDMDGGDTNCERKKTFLQRVGEKFGKATATMLESLADAGGISANRVSHGQIRTKLAEALSTQERSNTWVWVIDVYDNEVIWGRELQSGDIDIFSSEYSLGAEPELDVTLKEPVEVRQVVEYVKVSNVQSEEENTMEREALIERLATNEEVPFDREALAAMGDAQISFLATNFPEERPIGDVVDTPGADDPEDAAADPNTPAAAGVQNSLKSELVEVLNTLGTEGIQTVINSANEMAEARKAEQKGLVSRLVANERCTVSEKSLRSMDLEALREMAKVFDVASDYSGAGGPVTHSREASGPPPAPSVVLTGNDSE